LSQHWPRSSRPFFHPFMFNPKAPIIRGGVFIPIIRMSMSRRLLSLIIVISFFLFSGCGQSVAQKREDAVISANILLTKKKYDEAITLLEGAGRDVKSVRYLKALASAYAGKGGFNVLKLFADDLALVSTPSPMGGMSRFSTSDDMTTATDSDFVNLQKAIDLLLYAGGVDTSVNPTVAERGVFFNASDASEINVLLMYLVLVQTGRYFQFYGNTSALGIKGGGTQGNVCFLNYQNLAFAGGPPNDMNALQASGATGACNVLLNGHASLGTPGSYQTARLCQGVVLLNNFLAIFPSVVAGVSGTNFDAIKALESVINTAKALAEVATPGTDARVSTSLSQTKCESDNAASDVYLQTYFAFIMETLVQ